MWACAADFDVGHGGRLFCRSLRAHPREEWAFRGQPARIRCVEAWELWCGYRWEGVVGCVVGWALHAWCEEVDVCGMRARRGCGKRGRTCICRSSWSGGGGEGQRGAAGHAVCGAVQCSLVVGVLWQGRD